MIHVTLLFPSANSLWAFVRECKVNYHEVISDKNLLVCSCSEADIEVAKSKYAATESTPELSGN
jgi:hypothetical protein